MYITTVYFKLSDTQKNKLIIFIRNNFDTINIEIEPKTIIILDMLDDEIIACACIIDNKFLMEKLQNYNVPLNYYKFDSNLHGCFIYNLCVDKNHRGKKIAMKLLQYTINKMCELKIDYLHTHAENDISNMLFLKNGFIEEHDFNSKAGNKIYVMSKYL